MPWIHKDPEAGLYVDKFGGEHVYESTGKTLAQEFPEQYFHCPWWAGLLLNCTAWIHGRVQTFLYRWDDDGRTETV